MPDEVAKIISVPCTETSSYVNGAESHINGSQHVEAPDQCAVGSSPAAGIDNVSRTTASGSLT